MKPPPSRSAGNSNFDGEEEEGYGSGDYEDAFELIRIKVKVSLILLVGEMSPDMVLDSLQWRSPWYGVYSRRTV
jgi:hypothetical protein